MRQASPALFLTGAALALAVCVSGPPPARAGQAWQDGRSSDVEDDQPAATAAASRWHDDSEDGDAFQSDRDHGGRMGRGPSWRDDRSEDPRSRGHWDPHEGMHGMMMGMGAGMGRMAMAAGTRFDIQMGDMRVSVRCAPRESSRDCVDAATSLISRLREATRGMQTGSSGSGSPAPGNTAPSTGTANPP
jgi:hypothetical protein